MARQPFMLGLDIPTKLIALADESSSSQCASFNAVH
jgi:hypothetical protein